MSFLKKAIRDRNLEAITLVLQYGVSVHERVDQISPLEFAVSNFSLVHYSMCSNGSIASDESNASTKETSKEIMVALLSHAAPDELKNTSPHGLGLGLLHMVTEMRPYQHAQIYWLLKELIGRGVRIDGEAKFKPGWTPLVHHLSRHAFETAKMLLHLGANLPRADSSFDPVHASLVSGGVSFLKRLLCYSKETGIPIQWNAIKKCDGIHGIPKNSEGISPLHVVAIGGFSEILDFYLDEGLLEDVNVTTANGLTAVHLAAVNDQAAIIKKLYLRGASIDKRSVDESTPLHLAARYKSLSAVEVLLELGMQSSLDAFAMTPRMYASALKDKDMVKLLDKYLPLDAKP